ncbi:Forkhead box protein M1 [Trichoplax sp. H2]|nr:Forkhead box protein M1 [Trichoplax sp. H2]|eukprot:RDD38262.1 Forkhead box protein M1 [Trichoplax sp. H2]
MQQDQSNYDDDALSDINWLTNLQPTHLHKNRSDRYGLGQCSKMDNTINQPHHYYTHRSQPSTSRCGISEPPPEEVIVMNRKYVKPPYSYAKLITMAIDSTTDKKMLLKDIYEWVETKYPFYKYTSNKGWKNSIRHNLSLKPYFIKLDRSGRVCNSSESKGCYWMLAPSMQKENIPPGQHIITTANKLTNIYTQPKNNLIPTGLPNKSGKNIPTALIATPLYAVSDGSNDDHNNKRVIPILPKGLPTFYVLASVPTSTSVNSEATSSEPITTIASTSQVKDLHYVVDNPSLLANSQCTASAPQANLSSNNYYINDNFPNSSVTASLGTCTQNNSDDIKAWNDDLNVPFSRKRPGQEISSVNKKQCDSGIMEDSTTTLDVEKYETPKKKDRASTTIDESTYKTPIRALQDVFPENIVSSPLDTLSTPNVNALLKTVSSSCRKSLDKFESSSFWSEMEAVAGMATLFTTPVRSSSKRNNDHETTPLVRQQPTLAALNDKSKITPTKNQDNRINFDDLSLTPYLKTILNTSTSDSGIFSFSSPTRSPKSIHESTSLLSPAEFVKTHDLKELTPRKPIRNRGRRSYNISQ